MNLELSKIEAEALIDLLEEFENYQSNTGCNDSFPRESWSQNEVEEYVRNVAKFGLGEEGQKYIEENIENNPEHYKYMFGLPDLCQTYYFIQKLKTLI